MEKYIIKDETNVRTYLHAAIYKHACTCEGKELRKLRKYIMLRLCVI